MWNPYYSFSLLTFCHHCFPFMTTRRSLMAKAAFLATSKELTSDTSDDETICFGFTGDIMLGRGIDAILPYHVDGVLHESYMRNAKGYVELAIKENGPLSQDEINERGFNYIWGDLVETFESVPNMMVVNLETSLTTSDDYAKDKGINYRAHPLNARSLQVFGSDSIVTLANNHVLDWGESGLLETLQTLDDAHIKYSGAGRNLDEAITPATSLVKNKNVAVVAVGLSSAGVPMHWKADTNKSGVYVMDNESVKNAVEIMKTFNESISDEAIKIVSIHMGPNWNPRIPENWRKFAHTLIDHGADIVIAHSSHHVKGIEVYRNKMISYGLGDFLNDYEGITGQGYEEYRQDLTCLYLPKVTLKGDIKSIDIIPCQIRNLKVQRIVKPEDIAWIRNTLSREGKNIGTSCEEVKDMKGNVNLRIVWKNE